MYACSSASSAAPDLRRPGHWPLPLKALSVAVGFALFKPLGVAALVYFLIEARRRWRRAGHGGRGYGYNSAFAAHRRETLDTLAEEERAFADYRRREREARDRETFDRFRSEPKPADESKGS